MVYLSDEVRRSRTTVVPALFTGRQQRGKSASLPRLSRRRTAISMLYWPCIGLAVGFVHHLCVYTCGRCKFQLSKFHNFRNEDSCCTEVHMLLCYTANLVLHCFVLGIVNSLLLMPGNSSVWSPSLYVLC